MIKKILALLSIATSFLIVSMEKPESLQVKPSVGSQFEQRFEQEMQNPKTKEQMQELLKNARRGNVDAQINLAYTLFALNEFSQALDWLNKAQSKGHEDAALYAQIYFSLNDIKKAKEFAEKTIANNDPAGYALLGMIKVIEGDQANALSSTTKQLH